MSEELPAGRATTLAGLRLPPAPGFALVLALLVPPSARAAEGAAVVVAWNERVWEIGYAKDELLTFEAHRAAAMMHLAVHDALNAIEPRYEPYAFRQRDPLAAPVAAAAQAAHDVLVAVYPGEREALGAELARGLAMAPQPGRGRGEALGRQAAAAVLATRAHDDWDDPTYSFRTAAGAYQTTPPWNGFVAHPGFRAARPFALARPDQLRPSPPPALDSPAYAVALAEVRAVGGAGSRVRTPEQTAYALFWMEFAEASVDRLARELVVERGLDLWAAARLFAWLDVTLFDAYVATWDSKYGYDHWRPYTAVRAAGARGAGAAGDAAWEPLRPTPPFPEYVSAHAAGCAGAFEILRRVFGDASFTLRTRTAPPEMPQRRFASFAAAAEECADSRVRLGWHFRYSTDAGLALGRAVAAHVAENTLAASPR